MHLSKQVIGYILLLSSFVAISSLGVAFDLERGAQPVLKLFWKVSGSAIVLFILTLIQIVFQNGAIPKIISPLDTFKRILCCSAGYTIWNASFNWALARTSVGHVYLLNNCHSLLMVVWRALYCDTMVFTEIFGTVIGISGSVLTSTDHNSAQSNKNIIEPSVIGDIGAFVGAIGAVIYLLQAKTIRNRMGFLPFMMCHTILVSLFLLPTMWCLNESFTFSRDPTHGLFGWANFEWDRLGLEIYLVAICDFVGGMGYIRVMAYFDPLIVSIVMLMEPILATILGIFVGVASMPGLTTCIGSLIVITGTVIVIVTNAPKPPPKKQLLPKTVRITPYGTVVVA